MTKPKLLCFGDSNTMGILATGERLPYSQTWPAQLETILKQTALVIALGQPGLSLTQHAILSEKSNGFVSLISALQTHNPDTLILQLGTNDLKAKFALTPENIASTLSTYLTQLRNSYPALKIVVICPNVVKPKAALSKIYLGATTKSHALQTLIKASCIQSGVACLSSESLFSIKDGDGVHWHAKQHGRIANALAELVELN